MAASIGRALQDGFRAANRSWPGIGFFAGSWIIVALIGAVTVLATQPPPAVFEGQQGEPAEAPSAPSAPPVPVGPTVPATTPPDASAQDANVFNQLESAEPPTATAESSATPPAVADADRAAETERAAERSRVIESWFRRAWPLLLIALLLFIAANVWLTAGQIAYLVKGVITGTARIGEFWTAGRDAFGSLLGAWCLAIFGVGGLALCLALLGFVMSLISGAVPRWLSAIIGALLGVTLFAGMIWLAVRLLFWFIAVVMDRLGPVAGLKASWRATQGRWWRAAGLGLAVMALSFLVSAAFGLIEWVGGRLGAGLGPMLVLLSNVAGIIANLYLGFWVTGAFVRYYADLKADLQSSPTPAPSAGV